MSDDARAGFRTSSLGFFSTEVTLAEEADVESGIVVQAYGGEEQGIPVNLGLDSMTEYMYHSVNVH